MPVRLRRTAAYAALLCLATALQGIGASASAQCIPPPGQNQSQPCNDAEPPELELSPASDAFLNAEVPVTLKWWDLSHSTYVAWITWNGATVTGSFAIRTKHETTVLPDYFEDVWIERGTATGTVIIVPGQANQLEARVCDRDHRCVTQSAQYTLAPQPGVEVTPRHFYFALQAPPSPSYNFTVKNRGTVTATFNLTARCRDLQTGQPLASCSLPVSSVTLAAGASQQLALSYTVPAAGRALQLRVRAAQADAPGVQEEGWVEITYSAAAAGACEPTAAIVDQNSTTDIDRSECITLSMGPGSAFECGDLRLVYPLPVHRSRGRAWAPSLLYNSQHAAPRPTVHLDVTVPAGVTPPNQVEVVVNVGGVTHRRYFRGSDWFSGTTRRVAVQWDASASATGVYPYTVQVINHYTGASHPSAVMSRELTLVNRSGSPFGAGWWWSGLETLACIDCGSGGSRLLWVGGDGSTRVYVPQVPGGWSVWTAARLDGPPDTVRLTYPGGIAQYARILRGGGEVHFDGNGMHVRTVNRLGQVTTFNYSGATLSSVSTPADGTGAGWSFVRDGAGQITSIQAVLTNQAPRTVTLTRLSGNIVSRFTGPDLKRVNFSYLASPARVSDRYAQDSSRVQFTYDGAGKLSSWRVFPQGAPTASDPVTQLIAAEARGVAWRSDSVFLSSPVSMTYTRIDGPRTDVVDHRYIWTGPRGAPVRVMDGAGSETTIVRDAVYPGRVREVISPSGVRRGAGYDAFGRVVADTVFNPLGDGRHTVTTYTWDDRWHRPTSVSTYRLENGTLYPLADPVQTAYDPANGNTLWQQQGNVNRRTTFHYYASGVAAGQLRSVHAPADANGVAVDSLVYDSRGNLRLTRSPTGLLTVVERDAWGRDTLAITPLRDTVSYTESMLRTTGVRRRTEYDVMDRPLVVETIAPALQQRQSTDLRWAYTPAATPEERLRVVTAYDDAGRVTDVTRIISPDPANVGAVSTHYEYDMAGRMWAENGTQGEIKQYWHDAAGNVVQTSNGPRSTITMQYDALNRLVKRTVPAVTHAVEYDRLSLLQHVPAIPLPRFPNAANGAFLIPEEVTYYRYDAAGNQVYAQNGDAVVRRSYYPNGALRGDTLQLRDYGTPYYTQSYGLEYAYDLAGRVVSLRHPQNLAGTSSLDQFGYHAATGALSQVTGRNGELFTFQYDNLGRPTVTGMPGGVTDSVRYDLEGRPVWHRSVVANTGGDLMYETMQYDVRGKLVRANNGTSVFQQWYSGLGNLVATDWQAIGNYNRHVEEYVTDPLGNVVRKQTGDGVTQIGAYGNHPRYNAYEPGQARVVAMAKVVPPNPGTDFHQDSTAQAYDRGGNLLSTYSVAQYSQSQTRNFYGVDDRLHATQRIAVRLNPQTSAMRFDGVWEEYRYDPLGRRVMVRTRTDADQCNVDPWKCTGSITRFVWAGDQILWELRAPGNDGANLEATTGSGNAYGRVSYLHARGIDRPLIINKNGTGVVPHQNWRGMFAVGTSVSGPGGGVPDIDWPGLHTTPWHGETRVVENWFGSLASGMRDASGKVYMRNRYYDPASGQFTQTDPIGLAGGMNSYGFAKGDPISYSDPYGLAAGCEPPTAPRCKALATTESAGWGALVGGGIAAAGVGVCAYVTAGTCAAAAPTVISGGAALGATTGAFLEEVGVSLSDGVHALGEAGADGARRLGARVRRGVLAGLLGIGFVDGADAKGKIDTTPTNPCGDHVRSEPCPGSSRVDTASAPRRDPEPE